MRKVGGPPSPHGSSILRGTPAAIWMPCFLNLAAMVRSCSPLMYETTTVGALYPSAATLLKPFFSRTARTLLPNSNVFFSRSSSPVALVSKMTSRKVVKASVGSVVWYINPPGALYLSATVLHLDKLQQKLWPRTFFSMMAFARADIIAIPTEAGLVQPFCGAVINTSTPRSFILAQTFPDAIQSKTKIASSSPSCVASASFLM
mmetsp:Transcript_7828/g.14516  ORF Transcript_7828/g.14516 Transcript_7828/m.14516 type:complete len:204 (-) Transcript_7828:303-914(-)